MSKSKETVLVKNILDYMRDQNRPFSANDIYSNMKLDGKSAMTRALDTLVSDQKIKEKTYGKQKVYFVNQTLFADSKDTDVQSMDVQINELVQELNTVQKEIKKRDEIIAALGKSLTTEEAQAELSSIKEEIPVLKDKLKNLENKSGHIKVESKKRLFEKKEKHLKEYRRRKRLANDIIDAILEGYPKSKKQLLEDMGVEIDDADLKL